MNIAPVMKDNYTLGKRTPIPGMGKFDALSQLKVKLPEFVFPFFLSCG